MNFSKGAANSRFRFLAGAGVAALALASAPAFAQGVEDDAEEANVESESAAAPEGAAIIVTGSRIARPNLESSIPVTVLEAEQIFEQGSINVGDSLNDLPQLRSTFSQTNAGRFLGTTGLNLLDLRGLGTARTLTLVNGRRHVASDILSNGTAVDVNTIPTDLIERVDVVTGGNSAIYGSDAIAGVVNFILKEDYEGIAVRGHANLNYEGNFPGQYISGIVGKNFADGRGNITVHGEYSNQERVQGSDVSYLRRNDGFLTVDSDPAGTPNGSDGTPDRVFFRDIRSRSIFFNTLVPFSQPTAAQVANGVGTASCGTGFNGVPYNCIYFFTPDGNLIAENAGSLTGTGPIGSAIGGNGQTGREGDLQTVLPDQERFNINLLAKFEFSPAFTAFAEGKYVNIKTQGQQSSPAFLQGQFLTLGDPREAARLDNPFLNDQARAIITEQLLSSGLRGSLIKNSFLSRVLSAADIAAINDGSFRFDFSRFLTDLGNRDERSEREVYRGIIGARGEFGSSFNYEFSVNYGRVEESTDVLGNIVPQRMLLALDAGIDPADGQIKCRAQFDPSAAFAFDDEDALAEEIANCVPYNPFGSPDNSAAGAFILENTTSKATLEQLVVSGFISGDTSSFFELPGGPIGFAIGGEYRREELFFKADPLVEAGRTFYNALPTFAPEPFKVKEAFGEVRLPILADMPFFEELTVSGAVRVSDYDSAVGTTYAYNAGVEWQPVQDIRFRAQYGRSVRAPNLSETGSELGQNFAPGFQDPCRAANIGSGSENRAANCLADLGPDLLASIATLPNYSLEILSGSNPLLQEEKSDSYTIGAVIQPRWVPGLSITVDYFDIKVKDAIVSPTAQQVVNACYDLPDLNNQFCDIFQRFRGADGTLGPNQEIPGQILDADAEITPLNFAARTVRGIDADVSYRTTFGEDNAISTRFIYTHLFERSNFEDPTNPSFENRILSELGDPQDEFRWNVDLTLSNFKIGYEMRYIGPMVLNNYEDFFSVQGRDPQDADYADVRWYPETFYHDVRLGVNIDKFEFYAGVDNILNTNPPLGLTGIGAGSGIYRVRGRNFYAGFRAEF